MNYLKKKIIKKKIKQTESGPITPISNPFLVLSERV